MNVMAVLLLENDQPRGDNIIFYRRFPVPYSLPAILPTDLATLGTSLQYRELHGK